MDAAKKKPVVEIYNGGGKSDVVLLCEHASNFIPAQYDGLKLSQEDQKSHAAWDIGAYELGKKLSQGLDAPFLAAKFSRLIYDCNRPPHEPSAIPEQSELIKVPGNEALSEDEKAQRVDDIYRPFCDEVGAFLSAQNGLGKAIILVTIHSFTPIYFGKPRDVEIGILHDKDAQLSDLLLEEKSQFPHRNIAENEPYGPNDKVTHSLKVHGIEKGLPNVMIEVRNDLLQSDENIEAIANELLLMLQSAIKKLKNLRG